jgi:uncharacterized protein
MVYEPRPAKPTWRIRRPLSGSAPASTSPGCGSICSSTTPDTASAAPSSHDLAQELDQISVDVGAVVALTHLFAREMVARRTGGVINLASITSFMPMPDSAVYGASKSFVLSFSEALGREVAAAGVHVLAVCPGPVATRFYDRLGAKPPHQTLDTPERIVADALNAFDRRRSVVVPGRFRNRALIFGARLLPRAINARIGEMISRQYFLAPDAKAGR